MKSASDHNDPQRRVEKLMIWFHPEETKEEVLGDMECSPNLRMKNIRVGEIS